jgi:hypothetical protein
LIGNEQALKLTRTFPLKSIKSEAPNVSQVVTATKHQHKQITTTPPLYHISFTPFTITQKHCHS